MVAFANPQAYELWMGRWSERYLDVGAGTGVLGRAVVARFGAAEVVGIEPAETFVTYARDTHSSPRLRFQVGDAEAIGFSDDSFDGALALLILQELPDAPLAVSEMVRVTHHGGTVAASQWDFRDGFPFLSHF
jgi:ubiquinone/menaquinone biosynthesis C-methylase UbiE